jgi:glycyl-tRNA synthetase beta chain
MSELFVEIFSEEIPARMQLQAQADFKSLWENVLNKKNANFTSIQTYVAQQRLVVCVAGLGSSTNGTTETRRGPKTNAPDAALSGFLKSTGKTKDQLTEKDGYWYAEISETGKKITELLSEILNEVIDNMPWPKAMRWYNHQTKAMTKPWIRPVRSILCIYDGKPVSFNVVGFGLDTGNLTKGHRFLAPQALIVSSFADYKKQLEKAYVILDHQDRQTMIKELISDQAVAKGLKLKEDQSLLEEVAGLVDYPFAHLGKIEEKFMKLPDVVLSTSMRVHQKYFTIVNATGKIAPFFGVVTNVPGKDQVMLDGLERVLRARLADAEFFYEADLKRGLESRWNLLSSVVFHEKLGNLQQKSFRLAELMSTEDEKRAAYLCKCDLLTEMVGEFPELQGIMGEIYAKAEGEKPEVAQALREYYLPQGPSDPCPTSPLSVELALMDKLDTLLGFIGAGLKPTGSKDPFALRRAALGVIRLMIENRYRENLESFLYRVYNQYKGAFGPTLPCDAQNDTEQFIYDRLAVYLRTWGVEHDCVAAVMVDKSSTLWAISERSKALQSFLNTDEGVALKAAYKRAFGILSKVSVGTVVKENLLTDPAEKTLYQSLLLVEKDCEKHLSQHQYEQVMILLASLRHPIDTFFDKVTVNCEDNALKENRLALLENFTRLVNQIADFSKLQG